MAPLFAEVETLTPLPWWLRLGLVIAGLATWYATQRMLGARPPLPPLESQSAGRLLTEGDAVLRWLTPMHRALQADRTRASALLIASSLVIDIMTVFLLGWSIVGESLRPFLGLLVLFGTRQIFQALCQLPAPEGVIWHHPGVPSLAVTYGVGNDLFFSGHTALAVYGAIELGRVGPWWMTGVAVAVVVFEVLAVLALRAHYTMDVYAGAVTAALVALVMNEVAPFVDRWVSVAYSQMISP